MGGNILFASEFAGFAGGVERYMHQAAGILRNDGFSVDLVYAWEHRALPQFRENFDRLDTFETRDAKQRYDLVVVHKLRSAELIRELRKQGKLAVFVHDHDYYCPRRHRYYPFTRSNCHRPYRQLFCGVCGSLKRPRGGFLRELGSNFFGANRLFQEVLAADRLIVLSDFMSANLLLNGADPERLVKIPPAISLRRPVSPPPGPPRIAVLGQLIRGKGVDLLLKALPMVETDWALDIIGDGNDRPMLEKLARPLGGQVRFHGWVTRPETILEGASVMALPWRWQEPFGLVGPEALAQGIPLVGFDVGGIREYLFDGETGLLVEPGDLKALAAALTEILHDAKLRRQFAETGRKRVGEEFTEAKLAAGWRQLVEDLS